MEFHADNMMKQSSSTLRKTKKLPSSPVRPVTTRDVAALAGVNQASVSVVLNGARSNTGVSEESRSRIIAAAEQLGYRRNGMAAAFRRGSFEAIALLMASNFHGSGLPDGVMNGIHEEIQKSRVNLIVHKLPVATLNDPVILPKVLTEWGCDGLLIDMTYAIPSLMTQAIEASGLPAIWCNVPMEYDAVRPDDYDAGRRAARHLLELGHRRICYLDLGHTWSDLECGGLESTNHYSAHDRYTGVKDEVEHWGVELIVRVQDDEVERRQFGKLFDKNCEDIRNMLMDYKPTAVISYDDIGYTTLVVARDMCLRLPQDLSLIVFGRFDNWSMGHQLTTMVTPEYEMGQRMVQAIFDKIKKPDTLLPSTVVPFGFDSGQTCGPLA
jgi:DNA-binding LacI/PurR family transcriptional regulator